MKEIVSGTGTEPGNCQCSTKGRKWDVYQQEDVVTGHGREKVKTGENQEVIMNKMYFDNCEDIYEARLLLTCFGLITMVGKKNE